MTPWHVYQTTLHRRLLRLQRLLSYRQDGHGNELSDQALLMVALCLHATKLDLEVQA